MRCAALSAAQAKALHDSDGDDCWDSKVCPSRRSYIRNRDRRNQARRRKRYAELQTLEVPEMGLPQITYAVLIVYREPGDSPVHAIAAEVWQDQEKVAQVPPIYCCQMVPSQVHVYIQKLLELLKQNYGIKKFASLVRLDPYQCSIEGCFLHPKVG
ncbi:hypothetical protein IQ266_27710 [filamentous cyanobacterium LEGE 11480]|uniref:Uncharacterized protein n=1 Tax=Romeriopsis navalis LEGE 11480 TaxID=2777977 RepID=A0A928VTL7_9CYAN|nr:hypothetical protein [Romeriopsis navalis LEGE 11480]